MKKIIFQFCFLVLNFPAFSQIDYGQGVHLIDSCSFELTCINLKIDTSNIHNIWQIGRPQKPYFDSAYGGPIAILTDTVNSYQISDSSTFIIRVPYDLVILVSFKHKFQSDTLTDGGYVDASYDNGSSWFNVSSNPNLWNVPIGDFFGDFNKENLYSDNDDLINGEPGFSGFSNGWITTKMEWIFQHPLRLSSPLDSFSLRFHFISDTIQTNKDGWLIDDIVIYKVNLGGGVSENDNHKNIDVSPNPSNGKFSVKSSEKMEVVEIYNLIGESVLKSDQLPDLDLSNQPPGIYFMKAYFKTGLITKKIVLLR